MGDNIKPKHIVTLEDWSAASIEFRLAEAVLLDDFTSAIAIMKQIGTGICPGKDGYREWPLFKEFRKSSDFVSTFEAMVR